MPEFTTGHCAARGNRSDSGMPGSHRVDSPGRAVISRDGGTRSALGAALAALGGVALALQSKLNGTLAAALHDPIAAAVISFGGGLVFLVALVVVVPSARRGLSRLRGALADRRLRWWQCVGGCSGALFVTAQGLTVGLLGVAIFTVAIVAGQVGSSLLVDRVGLGPGGVQLLSLPRVAGACLAIVAVVVSVWAGLRGTVAVWAVLLPVVAGVTTAVQQAFNGHVQVRAESTAVASVVNFGVGTAALLVALAVSVASRGLPGSAPHVWWLYVGGALGTVAIGSFAAAVPMAGVLLVGLGGVAGQLVGALVVDLVVPEPGRGVTAGTWVGVVLVLVAVAVAAAWAGRRK